MHNKSVPARVIDCIISEKVFLFLYLYPFSACGSSTCTGKEKECVADLFGEPDCKCKRGWKENPFISIPDGTDDCVDKNVDYDDSIDSDHGGNAGRKNCIISFRS